MWRSHRNLLTPLWWTVISSLISSCQHHKGGVTSSIVLLPYMMMTYPLPTLIWLCMQLIWKQSLIIQFTLFDHGERLVIHQPHQLSTHPITWETSSCGGFEMMGSDKIHTASHPYIYVLSLRHLYPLLFTWRITNENFQKILFSCNPSHNFTPKRNEIGYYCCVSQLYFIGH